MPKAYIENYAFTLPIASSIDIFWEKIKAEEDSIRAISNKDERNLTIYASYFLEEEWNKMGLNEEQSLTKFELLALDTLHKINIKDLDENTLLIISTTKGNVGEIGKNYVGISQSIEKIKQILGFKCKTQIISNACISGVLAINMAKRYIEIGQHEKVVVLGIDVVSDFVLDGFGSFQAISKSKCQPFDANRDGINLGEGAAVMVITNKENPIYISGTGASNDANHLSGPSRTGAELHNAIEQALKESHITANEIDTISLHGTGTIYNDEMEAKALHLSGLNNTSSYSLKSYIGHTLGTAGVIETILLAHSLLENTLVPSLRCKHVAFEQTMQIQKTLEKRSLQYALKTASGFGGCNAALVLGKS